MKQRRQLRRQNSYPSRTYWQHSAFRVSFYQIQGGKSNLIYSKHTVANTSTTNVHFNFSSFHNLYHQTSGDETRLSRRNLYICPNYDSYTHAMLICSRARLFDSSIVRSLIVNAIVNSKRSAWHVEQRSLFQQRHLLRPRQLQTPAKARRPTAHALANVALCALQRIERLKIKRTYKYTHSWIYANKQQQRQQL